MDRIAKALKRLSESEKKIVEVALSAIKNNNFSGLDIKKLKGYENIFRARKGKIRIIYRLTQENDIMILTIERRSETTYKRFKESWKLKTR